MIDSLRAVFGEITFLELALAACFFLFVRLYTWAPAIGEVIGGFLGGDGDGDQEP